MRNLAHLVQFYGDDDVEIVGNAAAFLDRSLLYGGGAVVVATESHRKALMRALAGDVATAIENRRLIFKDAAEVLDRIVENGFPSAVRFDAIVGAVMRAVRSRCDNAPVHAFAEMGASLWKAGRYPSAVRLEQLWNSLQRKVSFKLYSTYAIDLTGSEFDPDALHALLGLHSRLVAATPPKLRSNFSVNCVAAATPL